MKINSLRSLRELKCLLWFTEEPFSACAVDLFYEMSREPRPLESLIGTWFTVLETRAFRPALDVVLTY